MDRRAMIDFTQRLMHAADNDARLHELVHLAPDAMLARVGPKPSAIEAQELEP